MYIQDSPPLGSFAPPTAHGGLLTGHWEFDLALLSLLLAVFAYSFLVPEDAPRGAGRVVIQGVALFFFVGALVLAVVGFRNL
ncbi:MAG: hypothetical protein HY741_04260 [Chloroflexi bacterium]|nr:hypothetical protein [Chloroflexota bacterium]